MQTTGRVFVAILICLAALTDDASAQLRGQFAGTQVIWNRAPINRDTDIVRWQDRWYVVCCEMSEEFAGNVALRILSSNDGKEWAPVARLERPVPKLSYRFDPAFTVLPNGALQVTALGMQTLSWTTRDGKTWSSPELTLPKDHEFSQDAWHDGSVLRYAHGTHDGNSSTVQFFTGKGTEPLTSVYEETFDFIPDDAALIFDGDRAHCVMSRQAKNPIPQDKSLGRQFQLGLLGTAEKPFTNWQWKPIRSPLSVPRVIRMSDGRVVAAVGLSHKKDTITLGELDLSSGVLREFLDIPISLERLIQASYHRQIVGLAENNGQLWVTYHASHEGKLAVHLAKVE